MQHGAISTRIFNIGYDFFHADTTFATYGYQSRWVAGFVSDENLLALLKMVI